MEKREEYDNLLKLIVIGNASKQNFLKKLNNNKRF